MKYLCLIYFDEAKLAAVPAEELAAIVDECMTYSDQLGKAGHYIASHALQSVQTATTLRHQGGRLAMTDGPFAETKEQLGGFYLIGRATSTRPCRSPRRFRRDGSAASKCDRSRNGSEGARRRR